jgi:PD-(D/E)XK nuclease superfamily
MPGRNPPEVLIVDLKTGRQRAEHAEEVCYYALLETLKQGAPPYRVATYYLDESLFREFDVSEDLLLSAVRRTVDGVARLADLWLRSRDPALTPGRQCWYCPALPSCEEGLTWTADQKAIAER